MAYQGWKNYQTWNVALWLGNDQGLYESAREHFDDLVRSGRRGFNAKSVEDFVTDLMPEGTPDLKSRTSPYRGVNWSEISKSLNEDWKTTKTRRSR